MDKLLQYFQSLYRNEAIYQLKCVHIATLKLKFVQAVLNIIVYQLLIVTNVPVNSAALEQFMQCITLLPRRSAK